MSVFAGSSSNAMFVREIKVLLWKRDVAMEICDVALDAMFLWGRIVFLGVTDCSHTICCYGHTCPDNFMYSATFAFAGESLKLL